MYAEILANDTTIRLIKRSTPRKRKREEEGRLTGEFPGVEEARETHGPKI